MLYITISIYTEPSVKERTQAEIFVEIFHYAKSVDNTVVWKGNALTHDLKSLLDVFLGQDKAQETLAEFNEIYNLDWSQTNRADARLVDFVERELASIIGTTAARIMVSKVTQEDELYLDEVVKILEETRGIIHTNKLLQEQSEALRISTENLQRANELMRIKDIQKDEFLYTITHELRTPLTSIRGLSEILYDTPNIDLDQQQRFLATIISESERMSRLITQVLDLEKLESGEEPLFLTSFKIDQLILECVDALKPLAETKNIRIELQLLYTDLLVADRDKIMQVLINILSNAISFCPDQDGKIIIHTNVSKQKLLVKVIDNGPGIEKLYHTVVFDKFYQKSQQNKTRKGSGLGLAISKTIIQRHKGLIGVDSQINNGATFFFSIPLNLKR